MSFLGQIPKKSNLCRNVLGIFKTTVESTGSRYLYKADCLRLKKILEPIIKQQQKEKANSKGLIYFGKISIVEIETGFDPYHNSSDLWLPCVAIKFKNISNQDINDLIKVTTIFIDNSEGEQIGTDYNYLTSKTEMLICGTTKQMRFSGSTGWYGIQNQNVTAKIYIEDELVKSLKVNNKEFDGMIR
jgi:hypothetical protein